VLFVQMLLLILLLLLMLLLPLMLLYVLDNLTQGRLRGRIGLFHSNFVAPTTAGALAGDVLTDVEMQRLRAQLKMMA
jgi:hypothetical protein